MRFWDVGNRRLLREMKGHTNWIGAVSFSPDGRLLATHSGKNLRLWDVAIGKLVREFPEGNGRLTFSPDGKMLATASHNIIHLWDAGTGKELRQLKAHSSWLIPALAFSADSKRLVSGGRDSTVILWDVATGGRLHHFEGHQGPVMCLAFSPDGKRLASGGSEDGTLLVWEVATAKLLHRCSSQGPGVVCLVYSPDGKKIATGEGTNGRGDLECQIRVWDAATGRLVREFFGHLNSVQNLAYSPNGRLLASSGSDARVRLWDEASGKQLRLIRGLEVRKSVTFAPDGKSFLVADSYEGGLTLYATETAIKLRAFGAANEKRRVEQAVFLPDRKVLASVELGRDSRAEEVTEVRFWNIDDGKLLRSFRSAARRFRPVSAFALSPDGKILAMGEQNHGGDSAVLLWDIKGGRPLGTLKGHTGAVTALAFSPDGRFLASGSGDTTVLLWELSQVRLLGLWSQLGGKPEEAAQAAKALSANPEGVVPFVLKRLQQVRAREAPYAPLIANLDSKQFAVRRTASQQLKEAGPAAEFALRLALEGRPSVEVQRRLEELLRLLTAAKKAQVERLLKDLDSADEDKTKAGAQGLQLMGWDAEPFLRRALELPSHPQKGSDAPYLSHRARVFAIQALKRLNENDPLKAPLSAPAVLRAFGVLEAIGTPEARGALNELAGGPAESRVTAEARAALQRLGKPNKIP